MQIIIAITLRHRASSHLNLHLRDSGVNNSLKYTKLFGSQSISISVAVITSIKCHRLKAEILLVIHNSSIFRAWGSRGCSCSLPSWPASEVSCWAPAPGSAAAAPSPTAPGRWTGSSAPRRRPAATSTGTADWGQWRDNMTHHDSDKCDAVCLGRSGWRSSSGTVMGSAMVLTCPGRCCSWRTPWGAWRGRPWARRKHSIFRMLAEGLSDQVGISFTM